MNDGDGFAFEGQPRLYQYIEHFYPGAFDIEYILTWYEQYPGGNVPNCETSSEYSANCIKVSMKVPGTWETLFIPRPKNFTIGYVELDTSMRNIKLDSLNII